MTFGGHKKQKDNENLPHPYAAELDFFDTELLPDHANITNLPAKAQEVRTLEQTPFTFVDNQEALEELSRKLELSSEVAIDVEHH